MKNEYIDEMLAVLIDLEKNMIISTRSDMARLDRIRDILDKVRNGD